MLEAAGIPFEARTPDFDEAGVKAALRADGLDAASLSMALAEAKARALVTEALVLGSDQTLELDDAAMLDKPGSPEELAGQLTRLSGRAHRLHAAAALVEGTQAVWRHVETVRMHVRPLSPAWIRAYVEREWDEVRWSVGGYHVEGRGAQLFERIEGSLFAVQGLPLLPLLAVLRDRGLIPA
jgi:septum formation protein